MPQDLKNACELCGGPAPVVVNLQVDGVDDIKSYCLEHAQAVGLLSAEHRGNMLSGFVGSLRSMVAFAKENKRFPKSDELRAMGWACTGDFDASSPDDLAAQLTVLEHLADYVEKNGQFPGPN